ncbi:MAG: hypothetical protein JKY00_13290 [Roseicyclus sp.]|nr:hypothetical protein [Roseicyclus sp.]
MDQKFRSAALSAAALSAAALSAADANTYPGSIRAVIPHPLGGNLAMTGFPGLETGLDGSAMFTPDHCRETLTGLYCHGARHLVVLVERDELADVGFGLLDSTAAEVGINLSYHPVVDYSVPSEALARRWRQDRATRDALLQQGGTLAFSCRHGAGRSGLMAAWSLIEAGLAADDAITLVRQHFPEAVENVEQEDWLRAQPAPVAL